MDTGKSHQTHCYLTKSYNTIHSQAKESATDPSNTILHLHSVLERVYCIFIALVLPEHLT